MLLAFRFISCWFGLVFERGPSDALGQPYLLSFPCFPEDGQAGPEAWKDLIASLALDEAARDREHSETTFVGIGVFNEYLGLARVKVSWCLGHNDAKTQVSSSCFKSGGAGVLSASRGRGVRWGCPVWERVTPQRFEED